VDSKTTTPGGQLNWYGSKVSLHFDKITRRGLTAVAARVDGLTKTNIVANDQVDTGFMVNSVYFVAGDESTYAETNGNGQFVNRQGHLVERQLAPEAPLPAEYAALVCVGANYAIFQEMDFPFLYPALQQTATEAGGLIQQEAQR
jgi:hypothetical protein